MMETEFKPGDFVVHHLYGISEVSAITTHAGRLYYRLSPLADKVTVNVPATSRLERALDRKGALELIDSIPSLEPVPVTRTQGEGLRRYEVDAADRRALLTTIVGIYRHNRKAIEAGRGISRIGEGESFRKAEELLHLELGHALGCPAIEVPSFIAQRLSHLTCQSSSC